MSSPRKRKIKEDSDHGSVDEVGGAGKAKKGYSLVVSAKDTNYGKSKAYFAPPSTMIRVYPDSTESDLWFNYEDRALYYPVCIFKDGKRVENHLSNVWVTMHVSEKIRGNAAPPATTRAQAQRGVYWFKAIKAYVFGEIEIKFEVLDERTYITPDRRITTDPLTFLSTVDVDEFGHAKPAQPENSGDTVVDYIYDIDPRMARSSRTYVQENHNQSSYRPAGQGDSRNGKAKTKTSSSSGSSSGHRELSEYEKKTLYSDGFLHPPRRSYKFTLEDDDKRQQTEKRRRVTGAFEVKDKTNTEADDDTGTIADSDTGGDSEREDEVVPRGLGRARESTMGLDHALFDPMDLGGSGADSVHGGRPGPHPSSTFHQEFYGAVFPHGRRENGRINDTGNGHGSSSSSGSSFSSSGRYERLLASVCNLLDTDKTTKGSDMAIHLLDQLERAQESLPDRYGEDEDDGYGGGVGMVNVGQLRELLMARRSLDDAIKVVLLQGGRAIERPS